MVEKVSTNILAKDKNGVVRLAITPDYSNMGSFLREHEEVVEKRIKAKRKSFASDWDTVSKMRFTI